MPSRREQLRDEMQKLQKEYVSSLSKKISNLYNVWRTIQDIEQDADKVKKLHDGLHKLAGSSGIYGFDELCDIARNAMQICEKYRDQGNAIANDEIVKFTNLMEELVNYSLPIKQEKIAQKMLEMEFTDASYDCVYLYSEDKPLREQVSKHLQHYNFDVKALGTFDELAKMISKKLPGLLIADVGKDVKKTCQIATLFDKKDGELPIPMIALSNHDSFEARVHAVRCGCMGYLAKPLNVDFLAEKVERLMPSKHQSAYRVLVVDDEVEQAEYYAAALRASGFDVYVITDALNITSTLARVQPELILLDVHFPDYTGIEIARAIRLYDQYFDIPVVFMSSSDDENKRFAARLTGAVDYLLKPVDTGALINILESRIARFRRMKDVMSCDSLTNLLNHKSLKEQLRHECARAMRYDDTLSVAMLDLDHFKKVNDQYGHLAGDKVLKNLSLLLKKNLRGSDLVGRYGGEEFIIVFPNTRAHEARIAIEGLRKKFANFTHFFRGEEFKCSFSAGVSQFSNEGSIRELLSEVDQALYQAKDQGRNQVVCSNCAIE